MNFAIKMYKRVNELLGTEYKNNSEIDWWWISTYKTLSENFIEEFQDYVNWSNISCYQNLSEDFIREFKDYVDWIWISHYQILSWNFILEFEDLVDWYWSSLCQPFIEDPNYKKIDKEVLKYNELYQLYQETKERGWFTGYVDNSDDTFKNNLDVDLIYNVKSKIYWGDLIKTNKVKSFEPIRQVKYV